MADKHVHGSMDTTEHEKTFVGMLNWAKWVCIGSAAFLIFLATVNG